MNRQARIERLEQETVFVPEDGFDFFGHVEAVADFIRGSGLDVADPPCPPHFDPKEWQEKMTAAREYAEKARDLAAVGGLESGAILE